MEHLNQFPAETRKRVRQNLRRWYRRHGRQLPWRAAGDPYRVWISEIMLQQTTVAAVVPYYERFLARFPDVESLAGADEQDVLRLWEGLGYYSRARNIHRAARRLVDEHGAEFPQDDATLLSLPGIGRYTAGAIASFAFDMPAPIVEANTLRLYCRLLGYDGDPRSTAGQRLLWEFASHILPRRRAGEFNQALMDLGATVCTTSEPECPSCPLRSCCTAFRESRQCEIPAYSQAKKMTDVTEATVAIRKNGAYLLRQRGESERWAGLWDFPRFEVSVGPLSSKNGHDDSVLSADQLRDLVERTHESTGIRMAAPERLTTLKHTVTRYRITLHCFRADHETGRLIRSSVPMRWVRPQEFGDYPLSVTGRKLSELIADGAGGGVGASPSIVSDQRRRSRE